MMNTRELLTKRAANRETGSVAVGGEPVRIQALTFAERIEIQRAFRDDDGKDLDERSTMKRQALYVARSVVTPEGLAVFTESEADLALLMTLPSVDVDAINDEIMRLNFAPADTVKNLTPPKNG